MIAVISVISIMLPFCVALCAFSKPAKAKAIDLVTAMQDRALFGEWFAGESWGAWLTVAKVMCAVALDETERFIYEYVSGRKTLPTEIKQLWVCAGRRSGKSIFAAFMAVYHAVFRDWGAVLTWGETGIVAVVAPDRAQAKIVFNYARAFCQEIPMIRRLVAQITAESITFKNHIQLQVKTASYRTSRGFSVVCLVVDECCFLRDESSSNPFAEILRAVKPSMSTTRGMMICISTPYSRFGTFYENHQRYFGVENPNVLFVRAPTAFMNPSVDESVIQEAFAEDRVAALSEFGSLEEGIQFRSDVETFVDLELVQSLVEKGRYELAPMPGVACVASGDIAGGTGGESTAGGLAAKLSDGTIALIGVREWKGKHSPAAAIAEMAEWFKGYGITKVTMDRYAGAFPIDEFRKYGIAVEPAPMSKSDFFLALLPLLNSKRVQLLDNDRLIAQLVGLERKCRAGGHDSVDHGPSGKDDLINAAAIAIVTAATKWTRQPGDQGYDFI